MAIPALRLPATCRIPSGQASTRALARLRRCADQYRYGTAPIPTAGTRATTKVESRAYRAANATTPMPTQVAQNWPGVTAAPAWDSHTCRDGRGRRFGVRGTRLGFKGRPASVSQPRYTAQAAHRAARTITASPRFLAGPR